MEEEGNADLSLGGDREGQRFQDPADGGSVNTPTEEVNSGRGMRQIFRPEIPDLNLMVDAERLVNRSLEGLEGDQGGGNNHWAIVVSESPRLGVGTSPEGFGVRELVMARGLNFDSPTFEPQGNFHLSPHLNPSSGPMEASANLGPNQITNA